MRCAAASRLCTGWTSSSWTTGLSDPREITDVAAASGAVVVRLSRNHGPAAARRRPRGDDERTRGLPRFRLHARRRLARRPRAALRRSARRDRGAPDPASTGDAGAAPRFEEASSALDMGRFPALVRPGARLGFLPSAAMVVRRDALAQNAFDGELHARGGRRPRVADGRPRLPRALRTRRRRAPRSPGFVAQLGATSARVRDVSRGAGAPASRAALAGARLALEPRRCDGMVGG